MASMMMAKSSQLTFKEIKRNIRQQSPLLNHGTPEMN
jgi:hypothetical protein